MKAILEKTQSTIAEHVDVAQSFGSRLQGLMFKRALPEGHALLIKRCNSIHTFFVRFPIDVMFLSEDHHVIAVYSNMLPFKLSKRFGKAKAVLETQAGIIDRHSIKAHDQLRFQT